jgi:D-psicose/D-tagatose/L-ribulose 3-epimerase
MKFGINTMVFTPVFRESDYYILEKAASLGYEAVELAVAQPEPDIQNLKKVLDTLGLEVCICSIMDSGCFLGSSDAAQCQAAFRRICDQIAFARGLGAKSIAGPIYSNGQPLKFRSVDQREEEWNRVAGLLKQLSLYAAEAGVEIYIEPLNRYKTDLINTVDMGMRMIDDIKSENVKILFDTYHANIEESDFCAAIRRMGTRYLGEVHLCDNNKGAPGSGHIDFPSIAAALTGINYTGFVVFESFVPRGQDSLWHPLENSQDELALKAYRKMTKLF